MYESESVIILPKISTGRPIVPSYWPDKVSKYLKIGENLIIFFLFTSHNIAQKALTVVS